MTSDNDLEGRLALLAARSEVETDEIAVATIVRKLMEQKDYIQAARWITKQTYLGGYDPDQLLKLRRMLPRPFLNIGGGPTFAYPYWENLDSANGPLNPSPFVFGPDVPLPFKESVFDLVYSSHALEHLDDSTFHRVLTEAHRVMKPGGRLLLKIPDFDAVIDAWRGNRADYFRDDWWNFGAVAKTFKNKGVTDGITARAAMVFCGFWNRQYGDLFGEQTADAPGAYCGPAPMSDGDLRRLLGGTTPHEIATEMRAFVLGTEQDFSFNHQNGWSRVEMTDILHNLGFELLSTDQHKISGRFSHVPKINQMFEISAMYLAVARK